jgi:hypothetical protein
MVGHAEDAKAKEVQEKMEWWQDAVKKLAKFGVRVFKWKNDAVKAAFAREGGCYITMISTLAKVEPLSGFFCEGGHGKVYKVRIQGMDTILL